MAPLGVDAQAAVAVSGLVAIWFVAFGELVAIGTLAIAARRRGEGDAARAEGTVRTALRLALAIGVVLALATTSLLPALGDLLVPAPAAGRERALLLEYLGWIAAGQPALVLVPTVNAAFLSQKDTRTPLLIEAIAVVGNVALTALLVPHLGVAGAALGTIGAASVAAGCGIALLAQRGQRPLLGPGQRGVVPRILRIGAPTCFAIGIYSLVYQTIVATTLSRFGPDARTAVGVGFGLETTWICTYWGVGSAIATSVGHALGAGRPDEARAVVRAGLRINVVLGALGAVLFWTAGPTAVAWFAHDPLAIAASAGYLAVLAWSQPLVAAQITFDEAQIGAGATLGPFASTATMNLVRVPLAFLLAVPLGLGPIGVWWAVNLSTLGKALWGWALVRRGRWLARQV